MKKIILLFWLTLIQGIQGYTQEMQNGFFVNPNAYKAKIYLVAQHVEKGLLYKIDSDSVSIASYTEKKSKGGIEIQEVYSFHVSSIKMIKTRDPMAIKRSRKKGALIGIIPGAVFGGWLMLLESDLEGQVKETIPFAFLFTAATFGIGAGVGAAIGSNSEEFYVDYSYSKFQEMKAKLDQVAYLTRRGGKIQ